MVSGLLAVMGTTTTESVISSIKLMHRKRSISLNAAHIKRQFRPNDISSTKEVEYIIGPFVDAFVFI